MPNRRDKKQRRKRGKKYNPQRPGRTNTTIGFYSPSSFAAGCMPSRYTTKLKYTHFGQLQPGAGNGYIDRQIFQTSCHDVDQTGIGHQPYMWDQIRPFYRYCIVHGMKWKLTAIKGTASGHFCTLNSVYKSKTSFITSTNVANERPDAKQIVLNNDGTKATMEGYMAITRPWGLPKRIIGVDDSWFGGAASSADPVKMSYLHLYAQSKDAIDLTVDYQVDLVLYVTLFDLEALPQS